MSFPVFKSYSSAPPTKLESFWSSTSFVKHASVFKVNRESVVPRIVSEPVQVTKSGLSVRRFTPSGRFPNRASPGRFSRAFLTTLWRIELSNSCSLTASRSPARLNNLSNSSLGTNFWPSFLSSSSSGRAEVAVWEMRTSYSMKTYGSNKSNG